MKEHFDILVIDDEPVVLGAACKILESCGHTVDKSPDADVARRKISNTTYDLVLCDLMLPDISGLELLAHVEHYLPGAPVVLITGYATLANAVEAFKLGVFDFIPKPFDFAELIGVVHRGLQFGRTPREQSSRIDLSALVQAAGSLVSDNAKLFALGAHSWVALERDGTARIGMAETFARLEPEPIEFEFPTVGDDALQGNRCVRISGNRNAVHRVWAPLGGVVVATNTDAFVDAENTEWNALCRRWLVQVQPSNLEDELPNLTRR
jgi:CheY-like chemotaxis protein